MKNLLIVLVLVAGLVACGAPPVPSQSPAPVPTAGPLVQDSHVSPVGPPVPKPTSTRFPVGTPVPRPTVRAAVPGGYAGPGYSFSEVSSHLVQTVAGTNVKRQQYVYIMAGGKPSLIRKYGADPAGWGAPYPKGQFGLPKIGDLTYSGGAHEMGGNPYIAQYFMDSGLSPDDLGHWILQGDKAFNDYVSDPVNIQWVKDHPGYDVFHDPVSVQK